MQALRISRARDLLAEPGLPGLGAVDLSPLQGPWINFDAGSTGILRLEIGKRAGALSLRVWGTGSPDPHDWGEVEGQPFTDGVALRAAVAFRAVYDFGFARVALACYLNKRLLVVDAYSRFEDGSGRSPYFQRDHFCQP
jgi:hypothetical protein